MRQVSRRVEDVRVDDTWVSAMENGSWIGGGGGGAENVCDVADRREARCEGEGTKMRRRWRQTSRPADPTSITIPPSPHTRLTGNVTQTGEEDVDEEVGTASALEEYTEGLLSVELSYPEVLEPTTRASHARNTSNKRTGRMIAGCQFVSFTSGALRVVLTEDDLDNVGAGSWHGGCCGCWWQRELERKR